MDVRVIQPELCAERGMSTLPPTPEVCFNFNYGRPSAGYRRSTGDLYSSGITLERLRAGRHHAVTGSINFANT
jgi:hypothetical protein